MSDVLVRLTGASLGYGGRPVLTGVDLSVRAGEVLGVIGPNGAGKTTLLRGLLGLLAPLAGTVERGDATAGYVPQRESLDPVFPLSAIEVVQMGAGGRLRGLRRLSSADRELSEESLARVGLADRRGDLFASLSGGQRQRVLIARALVMQPRLLVLDEPTSGVDRGAQERILTLLDELRAEHELAIVLVSHQLETLQREVDDVLVVESGAVQRGPVDELLSPERLARLFAGSEG